MEYPSCSCELMKRSRLMLRRVIINIFFVMSLFPFLLFRNASLPRIAISVNSHFLVSSAMMSCCLQCDLQKRFLSHFYKSLLSELSIYDYLATLRKQNNGDPRKKSKIGEIGDSLHSLIGTLGKKKGDKIKRALTDVSNADSENTVLAGVLLFERRIPNLHIWCELELRQPKP